ncbi:MAG: nitric-oxide reductase large subunit [Deltaproteobacteria bacterium]|nr:nitric-oxide reductase large subunit [Deltaproteobacteria bacterium]
MTTRRLWIALTTVVIASFSVLGYFGTEIYRLAPPIPERVVAEDGRLLIEAQQIRDGQNVWQSMGGQEVGSIWGHGAYVAPDWSADWLHREALWLLERWAKAAEGKSYEALGAEQQAALRSRLQAELRPNRYDEQSETLTLSLERAEAFEALSRYYGAIFGDAETFPADVAWLADGGMSPVELRNAYAIPSASVPDAGRRALMTRFFFWTAWSTVTERTPGSVSYTNDWPPEPLVDNRPGSSIVLWSVVSFFFLLAGVGVLVFVYARNRSREEEEEKPETPSSDPFRDLEQTPSMRATLKYFWVVGALILVQIGLGIVTAHYGVEGDGLYGIDLASVLPYSVTRTWHTQLAVFWIATTWLAAGLFIAPAVGGGEPKFQRLGVNFLFVSLLIIVVGSMFGTWYGTRQQMGLEANFWFGHQGYEYVDLGRFWQLYLLIGLFLWAGLVVRALWPALRKAGENRSLLTMLMLSAGAIGLFYSAGIMWGRQTHLAIAEYWRWWVVHLWVEGFFEVFATVVVAFLFSRLGLVRVRSATLAVLFSSAIFLTGGIIGTFHHLYFTGTPTAVLALGAVFSALEIVPLVLVGFEAWDTYRHTQVRPWVEAYRWPILFFVGVAFWNFVGAGLFGFLINPPIALYYVQGLNTTAVHGHTALFGVYGLLGIGLMLFTLRAMTARRRWNPAALRLAFWSLNGGLVLMVVLSLLPIGLLQAWASLEAGLWFARSAEFLQAEGMATLRWLRAVGDVVFTVGVVAIGYFLVGLKTGWSYLPEEKGLEGEGITGEAAELHETDRAA